MLCWHRLIEVVSLLHLRYKISHRWHDRFLRWTMIRVILDLWSLYRSSQCTLHIVNFENFPGKQNVASPKPPARPLTHYGPDEYLVTRRVVDVNVVTCLRSSREFWTNHVRRAKLKVWFLLKINNGLKVKDIYFSMCTIWMWVRLG